jgi:hypothetical protein
VKRIENIAVVRFGNEWWVVGNTKGKTMTREAAEAALVQRFPFDGPPTKGNPQAVATLAAARSFARCYFKNGGGL